MVCCTSLSPQQGKKQIEVARLHWPPRLEFYYLYPPNSYISIYLKVDCLELATAVFVWTTLLLQSVIGFV